MNRRRVLVACRSFPAHRLGGMERHARDLVEGLAEAGWTVDVLTTPLPPGVPASAIGANGRVLFAGRRPGAYDAAFVLSARRIARRHCRRAGIRILHAQGFAGMLLSGLGSNPRRSAGPSTDSEAAAEWHGRPAHDGPARGLEPGQSGVAEDRGPRITGGTPVPRSGTMEGPAGPGAGLRVVTTVHGTLWSETALDRRADLGPAERLRAAARHWKRLLLWPAWRAWLASQPELVVDSRFTSKELRLVRPDLQPRVVPLGFWTGRESVDPPPEEELPPGGGALLFAAGRLEPVKGFDLLLRAIAGVPGARLAVAGEGPERAALEALARSTGIAARVRFVGRVSDERLRGWLERADAFLNADQGQPAFGLANAEALACGCPVVASRAGAHGEVVGKRNGLLVDDFASVAAWTRAIQAQAKGLPEDAAHRAARAARARERFARALMIERLEAVYESPA